MVNGVSLCKSISSISFCHFFHFPNMFFHFSPPFIVFERIFIISNKDHYNLSLGEQNHFVSDHEFK